jgi:hypothetical protein
MQPCQLQAGTTSGHAYALGRISAVAPKGFQQLWAKLQPAVKHCLFGFDAIMADMWSAAKHMLEFAHALEEMVMQQWVRTACVYGAFL